MKTWWRRRRLCNAVSVCSAESSSTPLMQGYYTCHNSAPKNGINSMKNQDFAVDTKGKTIRLLSWKIE